MRSDARISRRAPIFTEGKTPLLSSSYSFDREMPDTKAASAIPYASRSGPAETEALLLGAPRSGEAEEKDLSASLARIGKPLLGWPARPAQNRISVTDRF